MKKIILTTSLVAVLISGCAIAKKTYLPDGTVGHSISCDGAAVGMNVCFEKAGEICGEKGYKLLNREGQVVYSGIAMPNQGFAQVGGFNSKSILVKCN
jgi:hypothetical protein